MSDVKKRVSERERREPGASKSNSFSPGDKNKMNLADMLVTLKDVPPDKVAMQLNKLASRQMVGGKLLSAKAAKVFLVPGDGLPEQPVLQSASIAAVTGSGYRPGPSLEPTETGSITCNCRKSQCLKLYCQCFAAKVICSSVCRCMTCANTANNASGIQEALRRILDRNPNAFDCKFKTAGPSRMGDEVVHKTGCRCRKSMCLKK